MEELEEPIKQDWYPSNYGLDRSNLEKSAYLIREWLQLPETITFYQLREIVEGKDIIVILSNGYNEPWQIGKSELVRGFSLYFQQLPVVVIKKQTNGAQAFTLFHELAHLLLHQESIIDFEEDYVSEIGLEREANLLAGYILLPDHFLKQIDLELLKKLEINNIDIFLNQYSKNWCVST